MSIFKSPFNRSEWVCPDSAALAPRPLLRRAGVSTPPRLAKHLGLYAEESAKLEAAAAERRCAVGLVVDPGLHAKGWTRGQALDYLRAHLGVDDLDAHSLIDGYASNPAAALACVGAMTFRALRAQAQQRLNGRFELREFHSEILQGGAMPLDILEAKMKGWMDAAK